MERFLGKFSGFIYVAFRIVAGLMFAQHGAQKLFGWLGGESVPFLSMMFFAGLIEFVGGLLIAVGFRTSWAAFISSGQMAVAYFMSHASRAPFPIENRGELAVLYCFVFLYIASKGAGKLSLDAIFGKSKKKE